MWMGLGWMDGMVIIGYRSSKSTFGANNKHISEQCSKQDLVSHVVPLAELSTRIEVIVSRVVFASLFL